ncbi:MAG: diguanylate cyclase [Christensenellaceae bacterium]
MDDKKNLSERIDEKLFSPKEPKIKNKKLRETLYVAITVSVMAVLTLVVALFNIPNPNMVLISGVVAFTSLFGFISGSIASLDLIIYSIFYFSGQSDGMFKTGIIIIGTLFCLFFVGFLHEYRSKIQSQLKEAVVLLHDDVVSLGKAAVTDQLTKAQNRLAFRNDYDSFNNKFVYIMILDIDNFKNINDYYGHSAGDYALKILTKVLKSVFNQDKVYRYGGDEFLVVSAKEGRTPEEFAELTGQLKQQMADLYFNKSDFELHFSAGYVYGQVETHEDLRFMISQADQKLYEAKNGGKNKILGTEYSREKARELLGYIVNTEDIKTNNN